MLHPRRSWLQLAQLSFNMSSASCQGGRLYQQAAPTRAGTCICDDPHRICGAGVVAHSRASSAGAPPPQSCRLSRGAQADPRAGERLDSRPASRWPMMHGMDVWPSQAVGGEEAGRARILAPAEGILLRAIVTTECVHQNTLFTPFRLTSTSTGQ